MLPGVPVLQSSARRALLDAEDSRHLADGSPGALDLLPERQAGELIQGRSTGRHGGRVNHTVVLLWLHEGQPTPWTRYAKRKNHGKTQKIAQSDYVD